MEERELIALLSLSSWCLMMIVWLFLAVLCVCLRFLIVVFPDHTHLLFKTHVQTASESPDLNMDLRSFDNGIKQLYKQVSMQE